MIPRKKAVAKKDLIELNSLGLLGGVLIAKSQGHKKFEEALATPFEEILKEVCFDLGDL